MATLEGEPVSTRVEIQNEKGEKVFSNWTNYPRKGARIVQLPEGVYRILIKNNKSKERIITYDAAEITQGEPVTLNAEFSLLGNSCKTSKANFNSF